MTRNSSIVELLTINELQNQLYAVEDGVEGLRGSSRLTYFQQQAAKVGAHYFYCLTNELEDKEFPFVYVYDFRGKDPSDDELFEINRKLWTLGELAAAVVFYADDDIRIIDTRKFPNEKKRIPALIAKVPAIDRQLRAKLFEGRLLEEQYDYKSVTPYEVLLKHVKKNILGKQEEIGCSEETLKKLTVKLILAKYLEEQKDEDGQTMQLELCERIRQGGAVELFNHLNAKLNGGIFHLTEEEKTEINSANLTLIANALDGSVDEHGQTSIWNRYDFSVIPIEFISRLYETFVISVDGSQKKHGAYYTPPHLAKLMVDELLPFDKQIDFDDFRVLDPSCGSGIFIVLAYKRLISIWMLNNGKTAIRGEEDIQAIKDILRNCIYGVDINEDALAITATSLQIELTSHVQPKEILENLKFDDLLTSGNLTWAGFFKWYKTQDRIYDVVLGNPPFNVSNEENIKKEWDTDIGLERYSSRTGRPVSYPANHPALIFLDKSLNILLKGSGKLFLVLPATSTLYNQNSVAIDFKRHLFSTYQIRSVFDFTPLRNILWSGAKVATVALLASQRRDSDSIVNTEHIVVRHSHANAKGALRFQIDKYDRFNVSATEVMSNPYVWKGNLLGGGRIHFYLPKYYHGGNNDIKSFLDERRLKDGWKKFQDGAKASPKEGKDISGLGIPMVNSDTVTTDFTENTLTNNELILSPIKKYRLDNEGIYQPPHLLIKKNLGQGLPTVFNRTRQLLFDNTFLGIACPVSEIEKLEAFHSAFVKNKSIYRFLITVTSPKTFLQMAGNSMINSKDLKDLPIQWDESGMAFPFPETSKMETTVFEDVALMATCLAKSTGKIFNSIVSNELNLFSQGFCEILNHIYESGDYKFRAVRQIIAEGYVQDGYVEDGYVWVTFEHTNEEKSIDTEPLDADQIHFAEALRDDVANNGVRINRIITYFGEDNRVSFIKPNKLKYWTRSIAYRDAENVKAEMFRKGF